MLAGSATPEGSEPIAQAYAGHQFGGFVPQLGDGRAILLGETIDTSGARRDLQLKGSGRTPFSRGGDGRAALGPVLRKYVISEAMSALGVPTTRALAAVTTGEIVMRQEGPLAGGVFTRVAACPLRIDMLSDSTRDRCPSEASAHWRSTLGSSETIRSDNRSALTSSNSEWFRRKCPPADVCRLRREHQSLENQAVIGV